MYKVMIIDDETMVRWGLRDLLDWEAEGFFVCEDGKDGKDGLQKLLRQKPDLALVDIKMPGMSGIELIGAAREQGFSGHFIILTGYSEFEFAKSAISMGVREYLLKPIDEEELQNCVRKIRRELDEKEGERIYHSVNEGIAREELLRRILLGSGSREELEEQIERYQLSFQEGILCVALLADLDGLAPGRQSPPDRVSGSMSVSRGSSDESRSLPDGQSVQGFQAGAESGHRSEAEGLFREKAEAFLQDESLYFQKAWMDGCVAIVCGGLDYKSWAELLAARNERLKRRFGSGLLIGVGHNVNKWPDLCYSCEFARFMLEQKFLFGHYTVLSISTIEEQQKIVENPSVEQFVMLIEVGALEEIRECAEKFKTYCISCLMKEMDIKIQILYHLMLIRGKIEKKYGSLADSAAGLMEELNQAQELNRLVELYVQIMQDMCRQIGSDGADMVIKRMYYYMEKNYDQDLKLESFAKMFNYNSNYLGKIFRREIGDSFNNALDTIRIANAKRLLSQTDLKVYQISEQVGYRNIDYFYLKFKKYVGVSPKEYKKIL